MIQKNKYKNMTKITNNIVNFPKKYNSMIYLKKILIN